MDPSHLQELVALEDNYWWHVAKRQLVTRLMRRYCPAPGRLVEGGIGSGRNLVEFSEMGYDVTGFDLMPESVRHVRNRGIEDVRVHDLGQPWPVEAFSTHKTGICNNDAARFVCLISTGMMILPAVRDRMRDGLPAWQVS